MKIRLLESEQTFRTAMIPKNLRKLSKRFFNIKIHNLLFLNLQNQDSFADINTLIDDMKNVILLLSFLFYELAHNVHLYVCIIIM